MKQSIINIKSGLRIQIEIKRGLFNYWKQMLVILFSFLMFNCNKYESKIDIQVIRSKPPLKYTKKQLV